MTARLLSIGFNTTRLVQRWPYP